MEIIKTKLGIGGLFLAGLGIMSIILSLFNYNIRLLSWIDLWGNTMGWIIRIIILVGGGALFLLFGSDIDVDVDLDLDDK